MAWWLSWLERRPVTAEVDGSSPFRVAEKHSASAGCFFSVSLMLPCSSIMTSGYMRNTETQRGHKDMKKQKDAGWLQQVSIRLHPKKTGDIFSDNEQQGNYAAALTLVVTELIYSVTLILHLLGVFKGRALMVAMTEGMILQLIPLTVYAVYGPEKRWMKNVLMGGMILSMAFIDAQLTYKTALLIAIPVAISVRSFSK